MISKEQIAHDLTMVYLSNRYGVYVEGDFSVSDGHGSGNVRTMKFPHTSEIKYKKVGTGEKGFLGLEKKIKVEDGYHSDDIIDELISEYIGVGLDSFAQFDGIPLTLKALLFNRYAKGCQSLSDAKEAFMAFYDKYYNQ